MNYNIIATTPFERKLKKLAKKHKSLKSDLKSLFDELASNPEMGISLGQNCYKIRVAISSKGKGKSGGARIITHICVLNSSVYLLDIYDKSSQATISDEELRILVELLASE